MVNRGRSVDSKDFGQWLKILCRTAGLTQQDILERTGIPRSTFNSWLSGTTPTRSSELVYKLSKVLQDSYDDGDNDIVADVLLYTAGHPVKHTIQEIERDIAHFLYKRDGDDTKQQGERLDRLQAFLEEHSANLIHAFSGASLNIREHIHDTTSFINEKTRGFVGRQFIMDAFTGFTKQYPSGYFFLCGDPGAGKSALAAYMVKMNGYVHHFNRRSGHGYTTEKFLRNICAQLIARYKLDYHYLPPEAARDAEFLETLLEKISMQLQDHEKEIIIVDALDEVDQAELASGGNALSLPANLPPKIYFFVTMRRVDLPMRIECDFQPFDIIHDSAENRADTGEYLALAVGRSGIQTYITTLGINNELFINHLVEKSDGNFMYLHYVLPEIERGAYKDLALPSGLQNYYKDHWWRMKSKNQEYWLQYELPVIATLTAVYEPVPIQFLADITRVSPSRIIAILMEWEQFFHSEIITEEGVSEEHYELYHLSFHDFLAQQREIESGRSVLQEAHRNIVRRLLRKDQEGG